MLCLFLAILPTFPTPNSSTLDHNSLSLILDHDFFLSPLVATTSPNINTPLDLSVSENHYEPSYLTSPHHINKTLIYLFIYPQTLTYGQPQFFFVLTNNQPFILNLHTLHHLIISILHLYLTIYM